MAIEVIHLAQTEQLNLSYHKFNKAVLTFALDVIGSKKIPNYIISIGPDSMAIGNALSRILGKTVAVHLTDPETGKLAEKASIVNQALEGSGLLVAARNTKDVDNALNIYQGMDTFILENAFKRKIALPEDIFNQIDLSQIQPDDLKDVDIEKMAADIYANYFPTLAKPFCRDEEYLDVTWDEYFTKIITLTLTIIKSGYNPDFIAAIGRGGLVVGKAMAALLKKPLGALMASSYTENGKCERRELSIAVDISINDLSQVKGKGIVTDDLAESGITLQKTGEAINRDYPFITEIKTATPYQKTCTKISPNYVLETIPEKQWIYFPEEIFERIVAIKELAEELSKVPQDKLPSLAKAILKSIPTDPREKLTKEALSKLVAEVQT